METARPFLVAPCASSVQDQFEDLPVWAGQVCPVVFVVASELAAGLGLGLAAKTLATPQALSVPAMTNAATAALTRDG
jgi:hypothetical protein